MPVEKKFVLTHVVKNVSKLTKTREFSPEEEFFGIPWNIGFCRNEESFGLFLYCTPICQGKWSVDSTRELRLSSVTGKNVMKVSTPRFGNSENESISWGIQSFINFDEMMKDYVVDDQVIVEIYVKINKITGIEKKKLRNFDESAEEFSDVVLVVEGQKFHVSKLFLASQSTFFKSLLLGSFKESKSSEVTLNDIGASDFQNFLEALYGESAIDDSTVIGIIKLADMYATPTVVEKCEQFLRRDSEKSTKEKLELAAKYGLRKLENKCMIEIKTVEDVRLVLRGDPSEMNPRILSALLRKSVSKTQ